MAERVEIRLEVEPESDPIAGSASAGDARHEFRGWVELMAAVEAARSLDAEGSRADPAADEGGARQLDRAKPKGGKR